MNLVLGIETSCDETAAAVIADGRRICSNVVASQIDLHRQYGGVFPEMASRQHVMAIMPVIEQAMREAQVTWDDLAAIAVTYGPGLAGSLLVGVNVAKGLAYGRGLPLDRRQSPRSAHRDQLARHLCPERARLIVHLKMSHGSRPSFPNSA